ncbi:zinc-binding dehydrogenase [Clostridium magnum]|uniref:D-arabitol-phosphate dehydrogenase n=1 Tax=Clostridium magnum DSM 2767 TaxID=1121326 RepID=A0A162RGW2_9CLOT|nr:zinc-binding dehydrogenase [Clostridium magnum]KZL89883.1 D-arabitol-phosphate dehydrogenase [Clostridium magnum DSM 2767]SHI46830.1 L-iditol 2-dehydrogenase [Clostridium magnum DSM 2767]
MKALVKTGKGYGNMELLDIKEPTINDDQVKIKVEYSGICGSDIHSYKGEYNNLRPPLVLGHEFSGIVTEIGKNVTGIQVGDRVTSETTFEICGKCHYCKTGDYNLCSTRKGIGTQIDGSFAEYVVARKESVHVLPKNVDLLSAALTEPLACCTHPAIEKTNIEVGEYVLIFGPGPIGLLLAQVARAKGAYIILAGTAKDVERMKLGKELGIERTINIQEENIEEVIKELTNGYGVDKVFDCSGSIHAVNSGLNLLKKKGTLVQVGIFAKSVNELDQEKIIQKELIYVGSRSQKPTSWDLALYLLDTGKVNAKALVSKVYNLEDWQEAFDKVMSGEEIKVVIKP